MSAWLEAQGQTPELCRWLWHPLAIAALNQSPDQAAAAPFVRVLGEMFGPRAVDSAIGVPSVPLDELYARARGEGSIESRGGVVLRRRPAVLTAEGTGHDRRPGGRPRRFARRRSSAAVPWHAFSRLVAAGGTGVARVTASASAAAMESLPIVTVNFWLDRPVLPRAVRRAARRSHALGFRQGRDLRPARRATSPSCRAARRPRARLDSQEIIGIARRQLDRALPRMAAATRPPRARRPRAAGDVLRRARRARHGPGQEPRSRASTSPAIGRTPGCRARSRARW